MGSLPPILIAATVAITLGEILHIAGLSSHRWMSNSDTSSGLWKFCSEIKCETIDGDKNFNTVRAMAILGMLFGLLAVAITALMLVFGIRGKPVHPRLPLLTLVVSAVTFIFILIGIIVYGDKIYRGTKGQNLSSSFILCIVGAIFILVGGGLAKKGASGLTG